MAEDDAPEAVEADEMGTIILMLGLYLIVLAFFILLNAISESSDEKIKQVSDSVAEGFGFSNTGPMRMQDDVNVTIDPVFEVIAKEMESIIDSYISVRDYRLVSKAEKMVLRISSDKIFIPGKVRINPDMADLFDDLSGLISNPKPGMKVALNVEVHNSDEDVSEDGFTPTQLAGRRATLFTRALIERDVDPKNISAGALNKAPSQVHIYFNMIVVDQQAAKKEAAKIMRRNGELPAAPARAQPAETDPTESEMPVEQVAPDVVEQQPAG